MQESTNLHLPDPRNQHILININGRLYPREEAKVSVFDSTVQGGDAVWEGLRVYQGRIFMLEAHLNRLIDSAKAMDFAETPNLQTLQDEIFKTLIANQMKDQTHIRLTLSRGEKTTSGMNPRLNVFGYTLIVLAEWKRPVYDSNGILLITSSIRRNPPQCIDSKIHHNNLINNILAKIEANHAGADDAIMLDIYGYISETNATNIFIVKNNEILTPFADSCLPGITRSVIFRLAGENQIRVREKRLTIAEVYTADEIFVTGTMGEITPVLKVDGRRIGDAIRGNITEQIQKLYKNLTLTEGILLPF
jgi:branched-chain amino acid aminotransferase group I